MPTRRTARLTAHPSHDGCAPRPVRVAVHSIQHGTKVLDNLVATDDVLTRSTADSTAASASVYSPRCCAGWKPAGALPAVAEAFAFLQNHPTQAVCIQIPEAHAEGTHATTVVLVGERHAAFSFSENVCGSPVLVRVIHKQCKSMSRDRLVQQAQQHFGLHKSGAVAQPVDVVASSESALMCHLDEYMQHVQLSYDESHAKIVGVVQDGKWGLLAEIERRAVVCI
jgi:hypothetical protein